MITIFKKVRQNLLSEGNTGKYLKYAIGEIVLVVIGILIALSINNWNEKRKDTILEKYYLHRLVSDLKADIEEIDGTAHFASKSIVTGNNILKKLEIDYIFDVENSSKTATVLFIKNALDSYNSELSNQNFGKALGDLFDERQVDMNNFTYLELVSTGKLEVIKNPLLREHLSNYYLKFTAILDVQDNLLFAIDQYNKALIKNNIPIVNTLTFETLKPKFNTGGADVIVSLKNLIWNHANSIAPFQNKFKPLSNKIIEEIEDYLEQL
jgi:Family of unknown function (DUF6090)